jgi:hypothetical protein
MHKIDRVKAAHARDSIFIPETGSVIHSINQIPASRSVNPTYPDALSGYGSRDGDNMNGTQPTSRNVITANEISGLCERLSRRENTGAPSQRQRILIARSQEQATRPRALRNGTQNINNFLNNTSI